MVTQQVGMYGMSNIRVKMFSCGNSERCEKAINEFLKEHDGKIINIQMGSCDEDYEYMVVYKEIGGR